MIRRFFDFSAIVGAIVSVFFLSRRNSRRNPRRTDRPEEERTGALRSQNQPKPLIMPIIRRLKPTSSLSYCVNFHRYWRIIHAKSRSCLFDSTAAIEFSIRRGLDQTDRCSKETRYTLSNLHFSRIAAETYSEVVWRTGANGGSRVFSANVPVFDRPRFVDSKVKSRVHDNIESLRAINLRLPRNHSDDAYQTLQINLLLINATN